VIKHGTGPATGTWNTSSGKIDVQNAGIAGSVDDMLEHARRYRTKRGRVARFVRRNSWQSQHCMWVTQRMFNAYVRIKARRIGAAKGAWGVSVRRAGKKASPAWASKINDYGAVEDQTRRPKKPSFSAINTSPWAGARGADQLIRYTGALRIKKLTSQVKILVRKNAKRVGL